MLSTIDGEELDVDRAEAAFAAAMAAPPADKPGMAAPARRPAEPAPDPQEAPHGWTFVDNEWRPKKSPGRPRSGSEKADKPRVTTAPAAAAPKVKPDAPRADFLRPLKEAAEGLWFVLASAPVPENLFGHSLGGLRTRLRVQAHLVEQNVDALAAGLNQMGQHNRFVARALSRLQQGEGGLWILPTVMLLAPFATQTAQLWSGQLTDLATLDEIAAQTEANVMTYVQQLADAALAGAATAAEASAAKA
jgi:hypothetical protein